MPRSRRPRIDFQLVTGEDPSLWRYSNVEDALKSNIRLLARLIQIQPEGDSLEPRKVAEEHGEQRLYKEMKNRLAA